MLSINVHNTHATASEPQVIQLRHFTDGALNMQCILPDSATTLNNTPITIKWQYECEEELVALIHLVFHLREHGARELYLCMPYIPNARQDRVQSDEEVFTLKSFAKTINWLNFNAVYVCDAHSRVSLALLDRVVNIPPDRVLTKVLETVRTELHTDDIAIFYPDEGAMKRYNNSHHYPKAFGMKTRNPHTGRVDSLRIAGDAESIKGRHVLIVDDICSKGDTALRSANELLRAGAKSVSLCITHCENTILTNNELLNTLNKVYTTDSIYTSHHPKITIVQEII